MALRWSFRCYVSDRGIDVFREWHDSQLKADKKVCAKFLSRLQTLANLTHEDWKMPMFRQLHGEADGISEIRFEVGNVQYRPLGYFSGKNEYTLLLPATEKGSQFIPRSAIETAQMRKIEVLTDRSKTHALWLALE